MVVLHEHLHIFFVTGEVEDMRPGGSLNTTDIGIQPGFDSPALKKEYRLRVKVGCRIPVLQTLLESLNSQDPMDYTSCQSQRLRTSGQYPHGCVPQAGRIW
jgi:hypothetical protein